MTLRMAVLGAGRWGKTLVRALGSVAGAEVARVVDPSDEARHWASALGLRTSPEARAAFEDPAIDAVVIAAPGELHAPLTVAALGAGKHVFVEKPLCRSLEEGARIRAALLASDRVLMVGHLMLYHPAVDKLRELVRSGELGALRYLTATRVNLGTVRTHENAWWSLAPHDVAMILALTQTLPVRVSARGAAYLNPSVEDVVFAHLEFPGGVFAAIHVSWLEPCKRRELTVVGARRMATFDDMQPSEKVRVFDVGPEPTGEFGSFAELVALRHGDITIPRVSHAEPLKVELTTFVASALAASRSRSVGAPSFDASSLSGIDQGLDVVRVLEAGQRSLESGGAAVALGEA